MKKFEIKKNRVEVSWKNRRSIAEGIVLNSADQDPEVVRSYDTLEDAKKDLQNYKTKISELSGSAGTYYLVEEHYIEENTYDEDGELIEYGDVLEFSKMIIELVELPSYKVLATFNNMKDADDACNDYDGDFDVFVSF